MTASFYISFILVALVIATLFAIYSGYKTSVIKNRNNYIYITSPLIELFGPFDKDICNYCLYFVDAEYIQIEHDDEYFYKSVEKNRESLTQCILGYQQIYERLKSGETMEHLFYDPDLSQIAHSCFDVGPRIFGTVINNKIVLNNGRHRYVIAKELGIKLPVYIASETVINIDLNK